MIRRRRSIPDRREYMSHSPLTTGALLVGRLFLVLAYGRRDLFFFPAILARQYVGPGGGAGRGRLPIVFVVIIMFDDCPGN